jgi:hypothetical protein
MVDPSGLICVPSGSGSSNTAGAPMPEVFFPIPASYGGGGLLSSGGIGFGVTVSLDIESPNDCVERFCTRYREVGHMDPTYQNCVNHYLNENQPCLSWEPDRFIRDGHRTGPNRAARNLTWAIHKGMSFVLNLSH